MYQEQQNLTPLAAPVSFKKNNPTSVIVKQEKLVQKELMKKCRKPVEYMHFVKKKLLGLFIPDVTKG